MPAHPKIEVFGLCGAGKSTIIARLLPLIAARVGGEISATRPPPPWGPQSLARTGQLLAMALTRKPGALPAFLARRGNWWLPLKLGYRRAALAKLPDDRTHILLDSGILQPFISFAIEWAAQPNQIIPMDALLAALPQATAAIHIHTPTNVAMQRYLTRAGDADIALADRDWPRHFAAGAFITQAIAKTCQRRDCPVIQIDNEQSPSDTALDTAVTDLLNILRTTRPA
ncbi:MAG: hypothetical protein ACTSWM_05805 [Alphaproteobacteria bacterium]